MHHFFEAITNTAGQSLIGYFARVINPTTQMQVTLASDDAGTPIQVVSGVANMAKTDDFGNLSLYVTPGTYNLDIYGPDATSFLFRVPNVAMNSSKGDPGDPGPQGEQGEGLADVMAPGGTALVGFDGRSADAKLRESYSVMDARFAGGAKGDNATNDRAAILAADTAAAAAGKDLFFPAGTYLTTTLQAKARWRGEGIERTVIKALINGSNPAPTSAGYNPLVAWEAPASGTTCTDMTFDGGCSADPATWNASNYNSFTGYAGPTMNNCNNPQFVRCSARNISWSGFRFYRVNSGLFSQCTTNRTRGNFGDGFIALSSNDTRAINCDPTDYTRGGVVFDRFDETQAFCQRVTVDGCNPSDGNHASIIYGGLEYNFGIWCENAVGVTVSNCKVRNNLHRNIVIASGGKTPDYTEARASIAVSNCEMQGGDVGLAITSLRDLPVEARVVGCSTIKTRIAYYLESNVAGDKFTYLGVHADYNAASNVGQGFAATIKAGLAGKTQINIGGGSTVSRWDSNSSFLTTTDPNVAITADVGNANNNGAAMSLSIEGLRNIDGSPVYIRWHGAVAHDIALSRRVDWHCYYGSMTGGEVTVSNCKTRVVRIGDADLIDLSEGVMLGGGTTDCTLRAKVINYGADTNLSGTGRILLGTQSGANYPYLHITGKLHQKDIAANGPIWQIEDAANPRSFLGPFRLLNKGAATATAAWAEYRSGNITCVSVNADDSVTTLFNPVGATGGPSTVAGVTKQVMR